MKKIKFPYQHMTLADLPGEKWKDIPDFEGYYQISNYGRVKGLQRSVSAPRGKTYIIKEKIRRVGIDIIRNKTISQPRYHLKIALCRDHKNYNFSVSRLVYYLFNKSFDLNDLNILVSHKDIDGRNTHVSNLRRTDFRSIIETSYKIGRTKTTFSPIAITQFDRKGKPVGHYPSAGEAAKKTGLFRRNISHAAYGKLSLYKGYFWRPGKHSRELNLSTTTSKPQPDNLINESLRKRLRIKKIDPLAVPPFLNLSTKSIKGERWKDVPGYEEFYQVSNYGRVKALQKVTFGKVQQWKPEQILRLVVDFHATKNNKEIPGITLVGLSKNGRSKLNSVGRLIYFLFVAKFNLKDRTLYIDYKDGNSLNLDYKNLILKKAGYFPRKYIS